MDCNIYGRHTGNNPAVTQKLISGDMASVLRQAGGVLAGVYSSVVAHRTDALAQSVEVDAPVLGGDKNDRLVVDVVAGRGLLAAGTAPPTKFGIGIHPESAEEPTPWMPQDPADDWVKALAIVDSLP